MPQRVCSPLIEGHLPSLQPLIQRHWAELTKTIVAYIAA